MSTATASDRLFRLMGRRIASSVAKRLRTVMSCGLAPQKLGQTFCIGTAIGIMPLVWGTSLICIVVAHLFRLNQVALQSVNYLALPLQLALLVPFFKLGAVLFPWGPRLVPNVLTTLIRNPASFPLEMLAWITLKSLAAWLVTALPVTLIACLLLRAASRVTAGGVPR